MLCSNCSAVVRPVVAVDIDGTLADYHTHFLNYLEEYIGWHDTRPRYMGRSPFKLWCIDLYGINERQWEDIKLAYRQGAQKRTMPIFDWAQVLTGVVRWEGAELWITTTRPFLRLDNIDPDTREWLRRNRVEYDHLVYDKFKYQVLAEQVAKERVIAVVDDLPNKYDEARAIFGEAVPILKQGDFNLGTVGDAMAKDVDITFHHSLREITVEIVRRIHRWKELHR